MTYAKMEVPNPDEIELRLSITLPLRAWKIVRDGHNWNPFHDAVSELISKFEMEFEGTKKLS